MEFSREMDSEKRSSNPPQVSSDWTCAKVKVLYYVKNIISLACFFAVYDKQLQSKDELF